MAASLRSAAVRRLFSMGVTTWPPSLTSAVGLRLAEAQQAAGLDGAEILAGDHLADRDAEFLHGRTNFPGLGSACVVELPLLGDVGEIERVGVGLVLMGGAMAHDDDVAATAERGGPVGLGQGRQAGGQQARGQGQQADPSADDLNHGASPIGAGYSAATFRASGVRHWWRSSACLRLAFSRWASLTWP